MERVFTPDRLRRSLSDHRIDPLRGIRRDHFHLFAPLRPKVIEERFAVSFRRPFAIQINRLLS